MIDKTKTERVLVLCALLLLSIGAAMSVSGAANGYEVDPYVIAGGGGRSTGGTYSLDGSVGQGAAGTTVLTGLYDHCAGFWCWGWHFDRHSVYLPLVLRDA